MSHKKAQKAQKKTINSFCALCASLWVNCFVAGNRIVSSVSQSLACLCVTVTLFSVYESPVEVKCDLKTKVLLCCA